MKFTFHKMIVEAKDTPTKKKRFLQLLERGESGTMKHFANRLSTTIDGVRSFVNLLRSEGHPIFNEMIPGSNQTRYFLAKPSMKQKRVHNKVFHTMDVPRGKHTLVIE